MVSKCDYMIDQIQSEYGIKVKDFFWAYERLCDITPRYAGVIIHPPLSRGREDRDTGDTDFHLGGEWREEHLTGYLVTMLMRTLGITPTSLLV